MRTKSRTSERFIQQTWLVMALLLCLQPAAHAHAFINQAQSEVRQLEPGRPVEREIAGGETHNYQINLAAGQFVRLRLEQQAMDAVLTLTAPDGKAGVEMNLTTVGGAETLSSEATITGLYGVTVRCQDGAAARGSYRLAADVQAMATAQDRQRVRAETLMIEANAFTTVRTAAQANEKLEQLLPIWRELSEPLWVAWTLRKLGRVKSTLNEQEKSMELLAQALRVSREAASKYEELEVLESFGIAYRRLGQIDKGAESYEQALSLARELKDRQREGQILRELGTAYDRTSRTEKAIEVLAQALALYRALQDRANEGVTLIQLGAAYGSSSQMDKAVEYFEQGLAISRELKNRDREGSALANLGQAMIFLSQYEKAISYLEPSLAISRELKNPVSEAYRLARLGAAYGYLQRFEKAIEYYEQAMAIYRERKDRFYEGDTLFNLAVALESQGHTERALEHFEQALAHFRAVKFRAGEGNTLRKLGNVYFQLNRNEQALSLLEQALTISQETKWLAGQGAALEGLGLVYAKLGRTEQAIASYERALVISQQAKDLQSEITQRKLLAIVERERGNLTRAQTLIEDSLRLAESLRAELASPESRASYLTNIQGAFQLYIDLLMQQHKAEPTKGLNALALAVSERQRARSLLDLLAESRVDFRQNVDPTLIEREHSLAKQLSVKAQTTAKTPEQAAALKREISQLETDLERAQVAIRQARPHYAALTQPQPLKLKEIQQQLDADTLLLEYALGAERSYLWAITRDALASYELPRQEVIEQSARQVYELLQARSITRRGESALQRQQRIAEAEARLPAAAAALSQMVLTPVAQELGHKRLVIVADDALQYVPFAMLPDPAVSGRRSGAGQREPLIVNHEIVSLPSASALAIQRAELVGRKPAPKMLAVIADPVFDRFDARFKTVAPDAIDAAQAQSVAFDDARSIEHLAEKSDDKAGAPARRMVIPRLPFTRQEATRLLTLTPKDSSFGAMDFQANRANVLNGDLGQYRYVHFATHGLLDSERPGLSSLVLSMVDAQGKQQDGFLRANDIYNLKLPAELVVLSACQTGLGKEIKGEGLVGLTRGFMYAGAARVVVSLWNVNDKATADLMTKFYERMLKQGVRPAAALRAAQVEMWKQKQWQSPYYWAAFTLQGEWR